MTTVNITQEFLEKALGHPIDHFEVKSGSNVGDGYSSLMFTIDVTPKGKQEVRHLLLKCYPTHAARQEFLNKGNIFLKELLVYNTLIPELINFQKQPPNNGHSIIQPPFPDFVYGAAVDYRNLDASESRLCTDPLQNCIIMPDLRKIGGFRLANRVLGFDLDHCKLIVVAQAKVHGLSFVYKMQLKLTSLADKLEFLGRGIMDEFGARMFEPMFDASMPAFRSVIEGQVDDPNEKTVLLKALDGLRSKALDAVALYFGNGKYLSDPSINKDNCLRVPGQIVENECPWTVALHGDSWLNNMMFRYDPETGKPIEVILLDLQGTQEGDPLTDICYALCTSTPPSLWKAHMPALLELYHDTFVSICQKFKVEPPRDFNVSELERRFHRGKIFGAAMNLMGLPTMMTDPKDSKDLEGMREDASADEFMKEFATMSSNYGDNKRFQERALELIRDLYYDGVI